MSNECHELAILYRACGVVVAPDVFRDAGRVVLIGAGPSGSTVAFGPDGFTVTPNAADNWSV